jgi:predicted O-methyltransferase YrrM
MPPHQHDGFMRPTESTTLPPDVRAAKTMLSAQELELLYGLARNEYTGRGEIVDGGAFLGGSTLALAHGLRDNPRGIEKGSRIHSYDLFVSDRFVPQFIDGYPEGSSTRPYYDGVISSLAEHVMVHEGDVKLMPWPAEREIEILFIDVAKSWDINDFLLAHFFPRLIPGRSVVIQQDYHWPYTPWLSVTMELLKDHVTYLGSMPWATAYYRWDRALQPGELPAKLLDIGFERLRALAGRAHRFEIGSREWTAQQCNLVSLCLSFGKTDEGATLLGEAVTVAPKWVDYFNFRPALSNRAA